MNCTDTSCETLWIQKTKQKEQKDIVDELDLSQLFKKLSVKSCM